MTGLFGERDLHLKSIEAAFPEVDIHARGNQISISGADATRVGSLFEEMVALLKDGHVIDSSSLGKSIDLVLADERPSDILGADIAAPKNNSPEITWTRTLRRSYSSKRTLLLLELDQLARGKSWLAVAMAVKALRSKEVNRIILTRPAVEAGERLGFLPGDLMAKSTRTCNPYTARCMT